VPRWDYLALARGRAWPRRAAITYLDTGWLLVWSLMCGQLGVFDGLDFLHD